MRARSARQLAETPGKRLVDARLALSRGGHRSFAHAADGVRHDFDRLSARLRFVDESGKPVPDVFVGIEGRRGGKSLYNHKHRDVVDTQIPTQPDKNGVYEWTWAPGDQVEYSFGKEGYQGLRAEPYTADGMEHEIRLLR